MPRMMGAGGSAFSWWPCVIVCAALGLSLGRAGPAHAQSAAQPLTEPASALQDYVSAPDPNYGYKVVSSTSGDGYAAHVIRMTSQQWRPADVAKPIAWRHWLVVIVPDDIDASTAALVVAGGSRDSDLPSFEDQEIKIGAQLAVLSGTVVAVLMQTPEQPYAFPDEPFPHKEDALVAYSWDKAIETGDYAWPVYAPMVKAVVRAMDTIQDLVPSVSNDEVENFVVIGGSKRGAASWLTAAVDDRVKAVAPMVIDIPNFDQQMQHHLAVYGGYAPSIVDYVDYNLVQRVDTAEGDALRMVIDPISYLDQLDMPKYVLNASGDQFFPPDSSQFYFKELPGERLLRYVPNSDHSLSNTDAALVDAISGLFGWYLAVVEDLPRPEITWRKAGDSIVVTTSPPPLAARVWTAKNPAARDFRVESVGEAWSHEGIKPLERGVYVVTKRPPPEGWKAYFVELVYPSPRPGLCQVYSTRVFVTPDLRPFEGTAPAMVADGPLPGSPLNTPAAEPGATGMSFTLFDRLFESIGKDVQKTLLEEALSDADLSERALRYCSPDQLDDFDDALELYVRLGTGQSLEGFVGDLLEEARDESKNFWYDVRDDGKDIADDVVDAGSDAIDEVEDFFGSVF